MPARSDVAVDLVPAPAEYRGPWLAVAGPGVLKTVSECRTAAMVTCPPMLPGSRVPPPQSPYRLRASGGRGRDDFDWSKESDEELADDKEDLLRQRLKRYLHLAPGLDPVLVDYNQLNKVAAEVLRAQQAGEARAAEGGNTGSDEDEMVEAELGMARNGRAHRLRETLQDADVSIQVGAGCAIRELR